MPCFEFDPPIIPVLFFSIRDLSFTYLASASTWPVLAY